ncbi:hypothetical protein M433DRAFT_142183 [Acidomyces richmondensis BFW]|nr:MAG: hypothetical protein FE78DRAFT_77678 [Acidomyces sp. 'richmondensis']KYG47233.1 hypothetical protein M433DRAFT_142183 [Acidomyces richmondensis BFW]
MANPPFPLNTSRDPNPLRPYHIPASISSPTSPIISSSSSSAAAHDILPDLDTTEVWAQARTILDALLYRYTSVLLAQPFDVAKTILQVWSPPSDFQEEDKGLGLNRRRNRVGYREYEDSEDEDEEVDDNDDDIPDYFTATSSKTSPSSATKRLRHNPSRSRSPHKSRRTKNIQNVPRPYLPLPNHPSSLTLVIRTLHSHSGPLALWRGTTPAFLYTTCTHLTTSFLRSFLASLLNLPPPEIDSDADALFSTLALTALTTAISTLIWAPLDAVRVRLILARSSQGWWAQIRRLPSWFPPLRLWISTVLPHVLPALFAAGVPILLRRRFGWSPERTPAIWSLVALGVGWGEVAVRLPFEVVGRRAIMWGWGGRQEGQEDWVVPVGTYEGIWGTLRGVGWEGLWRGWRVGFWGVLGVWAAGVVGPAEGKGRGEF